MRRWSRFAVALTVTLVCSMRAADAAACAAMKPFLDALNAGTDPGPFPDASACDPAFEGDLAAAFVAFMEKSPPSKVKPVVATIREWHVKREWKSAYGVFAAAVRTNLEAKKKSLAIPATTDQFTRLDNVHELAWVAEPAPVQPATPTAPKITTQQQKQDPPKDPPAPPKKQPVPITTILLWAGAVSAYVTGGLVTALVVRAFVVRPEQELVKRLDAIGNGVTDLKNALRLAVEKLEKGQSTVSDGLASVGAGLDRPFLTPEHLAPLSLRVDELRQEVARVAIAAAQMGEPIVVPSHSGGVVLEREALAESWKTFCGNRELFTAYENAKQSDAWQQVDKLFDGLAGYVPDDLKPTFEAVLTPARDYGNLVRRLQLVPRLIGAEEPKLPEAPSEAKELLRIRDLAQALATAQNGGAERLRFRFRSWVTDSFLGFADLFLQRYQQARLEKRHAQLEPGADIVRRVLKVAAVEPIDVKLGETPFDSARHVGRSMSSDPRFPDGVITAVVRNGFVESGQQVIRQPEVVVNRVR